jgi:transcriptional antiterminator RfaH
MINQNQYGWYVIYSKMRREEYAHRALGQKALEVFYPRLQITTRRRRQQAIVPLFPRYLFVKCETSGQFYDAQWCPGVERVVSFNGVPARLDESVVTFLKQRANSDGILSTHQHLCIGQKVLVEDGPFVGLTALVQSPPNARGRTHVLLRLLNRDVSVVLPTSMLKSEWKIADTVTTSVLVS